MENLEKNPVIEIESTVWYDVTTWLGILEYNTNLALSEARDKWEWWLALSSCVHRNPTAFEIFCAQEIQGSNKVW